MLGKSLLVVMCLTGLVAAGPAQAAKAKKRPRPCPAARSASVDGPLQTEAVVLYERTKDDDSSLYGCHRKTRRRVLLHEWYSPLSIISDPPPTVRLAGRFVALTSSYCPPTGSACTGGEIVVTDLRSGRSRRAAEAGEPVVGLLLSSRGSVAYVRWAGLGAGPLTRSDPVGSTVLDPGPGIDPESLATDGHGHLYWLHDNQPRAASFN